MTNPIPSAPATRTWQAFVLAFGARARLRDLAAVTGQTPQAIARLRARVPSAQRSHTLGFHAIFLRWHGRPPRDNEWPRPTRVSGQQGYQWLPPEERLLVQLVGRLPTRELARILTTHLRLATRDPRARRSGPAIIARTQRLGLHVGHLLGGLSVHAAAQRLGSLATVQHELRQGRLRSFRVGRRHVIPECAFQDWLTTRTSPPPQWIPLATLKPPLGIRSDKLAEYARLGYIPGTRQTSTHCWYISPESAKALVRCARTGRPLPWHGQPLPTNLRATWRKWQRRKHHQCPECRAIWSPARAPRSFSEFSRRYPPLSHGAKRHLTYRRLPALSVSEAARRAQTTPAYVTRAIRNGLLPARRRAGRWRVRRRNLSRWITRKCPAALTPQTTLTLGAAVRYYRLSARRLRGAIRRGQLRLVNIPSGSARGTQVFLRNDVAELLRVEGYTLAEAARRCRISPHRLHRLLRDLRWRPTRFVPRAAVDAVLKRLHTPGAHTLTETSRRLRRPVRWIRAQIHAGRARPMRAQTDQRRLMLSNAQLRRLAGLRAERSLTWKPRGVWWLLNHAALHAGVCPATLRRWAQAHLVSTRPSPRGTLYSRRTVERQARRYWTRVRFKHAVPPPWLRPATDGHSVPHSTLTSVTHGAEP